MNARTTDLKSKVEVRRSMLDELREQESVAKKFGQDVRSIQGSIQAQQKLLYSDACSLASQLGKLPPQAVTVRDAVQPPQWRHGDPPTPDHKPMNYPYRGQKKSPYYKNCHDLDCYPRDEYDAERAAALSSANEHPWVGGFYIPGAEVAVQTIAFSAARVRCHVPPFVSGGHPAHVSETKVVMHNGQLVRVWADGIKPHS